MSQAPGAAWRFLAWVGRRLVCAALHRLQTFAWCRLVLLTADELVLQSYFAESDVTEYTTESPESGLRFVCKFS